MALLPLRIVSAPSILCAIAWGVRIDEDAAPAFPGWCTKNNGTPCYPPYAEDACVETPGEYGGSWCYTDADGSWEGPCLGYLLHPSGKCKPPIPEPTPPTNAMCTFEGKVCVGECVQTPGEYGGSWCSYDAEGHWAGPCSKCDSQSCLGPTGQPIPSECLAGNGKWYSVTDQMGEGVCDDDSCSMRCTKEGRLFHSDAGPEKGKGEERDCQVVVQTTAPATPHTEVAPAIYTYTQVPTTYTAPRRRDTRRRAPPSDAEARRRAAPRRRSPGSATSGGEHANPRRRAQSAYGNAQTTSGGI